MCSVRGMCLGFAFVIMAHRRNNDVITNIPKWLANLPPQRASDARMGDQPSQWESDPERERQLQLQRARISKRDPALWRQMTEDEVRLAAAAEAAASLSELRLTRLEAAASWACVGRLNPRDDDSRRLVRARLQSIGWWAVPGSSMLLFGSTACGLHAHGADLDVTLLPAGPRPPSYVEQQWFVRLLATAFQSFQASGEFTQVSAPAL